jgi:hypothetical protein
LERLHGVKLTHQEQDGTNIIVTEEVTRQFVKTRLEEYKNQGGHVLLYCQHKATLLQLLLQHTTAEEVSRASLGCHPVLILFLELSAISRSLSKASFG